MSCHGVMDKAGWFPRIGDQVRSETYQVRHDLRFAFTRLDRTLTDVTVILVRFRAALPMATEAVHGIGQQIGQFFD